MKEFSQQRCDVPLLKCDTQALETRYFRTHPICPENIPDLGPLALPDRDGSYHEFQTKRKRKEDGLLQQDAKRAQRKKVPVNTVICSYPCLRPIVAKILRVCRTATPYQFTTVLFLRMPAPLGQAQRQPRGSSPHRRATVPEKSSSWVY